MAILPEKLVERLNTIYRLGEYKFGKELQSCLQELSNGPGIGVCLRLPNYVSVAAAEAVCTDDAGVIFFNSGTNTIDYYDNNGDHVVIDFPTKCVEVDTNTASILVNQNSITAIINQLNVAQGDILSLQTTMADHCHDGTDSTRIIIDKILSQDAPGSNVPINYVLCSDGASGWLYVDKETLGSSVDIESVGTGESLITATSTATDIDFKTVTEGCGIALNSTADEIEVAVDFDGMPNVGTALDLEFDSILIHDSSADACVQTTLQSLVTALDVTSSACCLPNPGGLTLLQPVYIDSTGTVTPSDFSDNNTVAQYVVTGFRNSNTEVCIQNFGPATFDAPHGLTVGDCYFEGPSGSTTSIQPTTGINNVLYHVISDTKISVVAGTRPFEFTN
jgi:hypothetical protein